MLNQANQSQQHDDFINDPNLFLAVAMVKSISQLRDGNGASSEEAQEDSAMEGANMADLIGSSSKPDEMIELTPILDLIDKLEFKKTLSIQDVTSLTTTIQTQFSNTDVFKEQSRKVKEFMSLLYYTLLNTHTLFNHHNFIEQQTYQKFCKESLNLVKRVLESLSKKESESQDFNLWLPTAQKILLMLTSQTYFEDSYYRYMRSSHIRVDPADLESLNQYLAEISPHIYPNLSALQSKKAIVKKEDDSNQEMIIINTSSNLTLTEDDSLLKSLDYIPPDYNTLQNLLKEHIQNRNEWQDGQSKDASVDEGMSQEEEKQGERKNIYSICKDYITSNKIFEQYTKAIDKLLQLTDDPSSFALIETSLFNKILRSIDKLKIKHKSFTTFIQKTISDNCTKAIKNLIKVGKDESVQSQMDVDEQSSLAQEPDSTDHESILAQSLANLSKSIEILQDIFQQFANNKNDQQLQKFKQKIIDSFDHIIIQSEGFSLLLNLLKTNKRQKEYQQMFLTLANSVSMYLFQIQKQKIPINAKSLVNFMETITVFIRILCQIKDGKSDDLSDQDSKKGDSKKSEQKNEVFSIRTRGQRKKEQQKPGKEEETKKSPRPSRKGKTPEKEKTTSVAKEINFPQKLTNDEVFKTCISSLVMLTPLFLQNEITQAQLDNTIFENLIMITLKCPKATSRLLQGVLGEFTKPSLANYTKEAQTKIFETMASKCDVIVFNNQLTILALRFMILFNQRTDLIDMVAQLLCERFILGTDNKSLEQPPLKNLGEIYGGPNLPRYLLFIGCLSLVNDTQTNKWIQNIVAKMKSNDKVPTQTLLVPFNLVELCLLNQNTIKKFKPLLHQFMIKGISDDLAPVQQDLDKLITSIAAQDPQEVYNLRLISTNFESLDLYFVAKLIKEKLSLTPNLTQSKFLSEIKPSIIAILKTAQRVNQALYADYKQNFQKESDEPTWNILKMWFLTEHFSLQNQEILTRNVPFDYEVHDDFKKLSLAMDWLIHYNKELKTMFCRILSEHIDKEKNGQELSSDRNFLEVLLSLINIDNISNTNIAKVLSLLSLPKSDEKQTIQTIFDPLLNSSQIKQLLINKEELLFSMLLSLGNQSNSLQQIISIQVLVKQILCSLQNVIIANNHQQDKDVIAQMAKQTLQIRYENRFIEYTENGSSFIDHDISDKLLKKAGGDSINNKDFIWLRQLDKSLNILIQSQTFLNASQTGKESISKQVICSIVKEVLTSIPNYNVFKTNEELKVVQNYLLQSSDNQQAVLLNNLMKNSNQQTKDLLWDLITSQDFIFIDDDKELIQDETQIQKKGGGVQLVINFSDGATNKKSSAVKRGVNKKTLNIEASQQPSQQDIIDNSQHSQVQEKPQRNMVAEKISYLIIDMLKEKENIESATLISKGLKNSLLNNNQFDNYLAFALINPQLGDIAKRLIHQLLAQPVYGDLEEGKQLRAQLQVFILENLVKAVKTLSNTQTQASEQQVLKSLELALISSEDNKQLIIFITQCILPQHFETEIGRLSILDFLCQLGIPTFSKQENGNQQKYNQAYIQEKRNKFQQEKLNNKKNKSPRGDQQDDNDSQTEALQGNDSNKKTDTQEGIEGYKQDKLNKLDSNYERYMERPEEVCTYVRTKKDFSQQHWYFCYTCGLVGSNGCCAVCARRCHKGHHVVYSRKSNFFCDCGDGGKCTSLKPVNQSGPQQPSRDDPNARSERMEILFQRKREERERERNRERPPERGGFPGAGRKKPHAEQEARAAGLIYEEMNQDRDFPNLFSNFGGGGPGLPLRRDLPDEQIEDDAQLIFSQFGGLNRFIERAQQPGIEQFQILSESSDEDQIMEREMHQENMGESGEPDLGQGDQQHPFRSVRGLMQIFGRMQEKREEIRNQQFPNNNNQNKLDHDASHSSIYSQINPNEDPLSEASSTPRYSQIPINNIQTGLNSQEFLQSDLTNDLLADIIHNHQDSFDLVFTKLIQLLEEQISSKEQEILAGSMEIDQSNEVVSPRKRERQAQIGLVQQKKDINLISDLTISKKHLKEGSFNVKIQEQNKAVSLYNLNQTNILDSNKDGLIAIGENGDTVGFYLSSILFEDSLNQNAPTEAYQAEPKDPNNPNLISKVDSQQIGFQAMSLRFNPSNQQFLAIAGIKDLEILTLSKQGKVQSRLKVDLMLEAFGLDLTIIKVEWIPGSQTMIAVGTRQFIRIYDLSEDNISPIKNMILMSNEDEFTDFSISKHQINLTQPHLAKCSFLIGTKNGELFIQEITYNISLGGAQVKSEDEQSSLMNYEDNSQIYLTQILKIDNGPQAQQVLAVYYSPQSEIVIISYANNALYIGKVDHINNDFLLNGFKVQIIDDLTNGQPASTQTVKAYISKNGEQLVNFRELAFIQGQTIKDGKHNDSPIAYFQAYGKKLGQHTAIPVLIRIQQNSIDFNIIKGSSSSSQSTPSPTLGITFVKNSQKTQKIMRLITIQEDGYATGFSISNLQHLNDTGRKGPSHSFYHGLANKFQIGQQTSSILKNELPKEVILSVNFFEKLKNIFNEGEIRNQLIFSGDIVNYFKTSKATFEQLSKINGTGPVIQEPTKKIIKMILKLDHPDQFLSGIRVRVENSSNKPHYSFRILNRTIKLHNKGQIWYDIPLCDAEIMYGLSNSIDTEFITDDPKVSPLRIFAIEAYCQSKREFGYKEKIKRFEKLKEKQLQSENKQAQPLVSNEEAQNSEILKTKGLPLLSWREKNNLIKQKCSNVKDQEMIISLDIIASVIHNTTNKDQLLNLLEKLKQMLRLQYRNILTKQSIITSAIKRCLRSILSKLNPQAILGDPLNYDTLKDQIFIQIIRESINNQNINELTQEDIRYYIKDLVKIYMKRHIQIFKILESEPSLIEHLTSAYLKDLQNDEFLLQDITNILSLIFAQFCFQANQFLMKTLGFDMPPTELIRFTYQHTDLSSFFKILQPFLLHQDDQVQKLTLSKVLEISKKYQKTMIQILKSNHLPQARYLQQESGLENIEKILIIDFSPHLIRYLLNEVIPQSQSSGDVAYSLVYKLIKQFEQTNSIYTKLGKQGNDTDFSSFITESLVGFISNVLPCQVKNDFYDQNNENQAKFTYSNLVLINILLQQELSNDKIKIKQSNLGLDKTTYLNEIFKILQSDKQTIEKLQIWILAVLNSYLQGFSKGLCSYKFKYEDGVPTDIEDFYSSQKGGKGNGNSGVQLLRPLQETSPWKWHPLFIRTNDIFELLDRKIPAQILLFTLQVLQNCIQESDLQSIIITIGKISFSRPTKKFLKDIGSMVLQKLMTPMNQEAPLDDKNKQQIQQRIQSQRSQIKFQEFFQDFEILYTRFLKKKIQLPFNMQFHLHKQLVKIWGKANINPLSWKQFLSQQNQLQIELFLSMLFESAFQLNEESSTLCLNLCALALENYSLANSILYSYNLFRNETPFDLIKVLQNTISLQAIPEDVQILLKDMKSIHTDQIDISKLIDIQLLGKNKKKIRIASAHLLKGLYESSSNKIQLFKVLIQKISTLRSAGVNSQEFLAVLSYICKVQSQNNNVSFQDQNEQFKFIANEIYKQIAESNVEITAHPNLELYATLQRLSPYFSFEVKQEIKPLQRQLDQEEFLKHISDPQMLQLNSQPPIFEKQPATESNKKISNPYMLESEACSKCYEQKSLPFTFMKLNDVKSEARFTDSCLIYKFNQTYLLKQISLGIHDIKGQKLVKSISVYINNKQGVDLADMRNNWTHWRKVQVFSAELGQKSIDIAFTLPVHATNLLLEFQTVTISKPIPPKGTVPTQQTLTQHTQGLDTLLGLFPREIALKFSTKSQNNEAILQQQSQSVEKEQMFCPRCGKQVTGKHNVCNSCGESASQCTFCRNINYEKPDGFICNECGLSRYAKFDISFIVKPGFASERIENEDQKNVALQQIEVHLQSAQTQYASLMKKRILMIQMIKKINEGQEGASAKHLQELFIDECVPSYQNMMKSLNTIKILRVEIDSFQQGILSKLSTGNNDNGKAQISNKNNDDDDQIMCLEEEKMPLPITPIKSKKISQQDIKQQIASSSTSQNCFSCIQENLRSTLVFLENTASAMRTFYNEKDFLDLLYIKNLKMHSQSIQQPARKSICVFLKEEDEKLSAMMDKIFKDLFSNKENIPAHLISQTLVQESQLVLDLVDQIETQGNSSIIPKTSEQYKTKVLQAFWKILFQGLKEGEKNASIAEQIVANFFVRIRELIKSSEPVPPTSNQQVSIEETVIKQESSLKQEMKDNITLSFKEPQNQRLQQYFGNDINGRNGHIMIRALLLPTSYKVREEAKDILTFLNTKDQSLQPLTLKSLLEFIDVALSQEGSTNEQYFDILSTLLSSTTIKEKIKTDEDLKDKDNLYVIAFKTLFSKIDLQLEKLVILEKAKENLGNDGFMPSISMGQSLSRIVALIATMMKDSEILKKVVQSNVTIVIMSYLRIRKLNLTKNKTIQNCEVEIEKMFKELHSQREEEKENFIIECMKIIESGECDFQEQRFLLEEICKVIDPVKPEPIYLLNLNKAPSQEFFLRGKMSKNPYTNQSLGKTMGDVRQKICKEMELAEPEMMELLVANKIIGVDLQIKSVYEQVWWPSLCRQRNQDEYEIPPIEEAPKANLAPMNVTFRLVGIDGEATEDRVENLADGDEVDSGNQAAIEKKFAVTAVLSRNFESTSQVESQPFNEQTTGIKILLNVLDSITSLQRQRYLAEQLFKLISYAIKNKQNRQEFVRNKQSVNLIAKRLFESVGMQSQIEGKKSQSLFDMILVILESLVVEMNQDEPASANKVQTDKMEVDQAIIPQIEHKENKQAADHIGLFIQIMQDACDEMIAAHQSLDKTSKKIKAVSKILPFLLNKEDELASEIAVKFLVENFNYSKLDSHISQDWTSNDKFKAQFYIERIIEILESIPLQKNFIKDMIQQSNSGQLLKNICSFLEQNVLVNLDSEEITYQKKLAAQYVLKALNGQIRNHPQSQQILAQYDTFAKLYQLSQAKFKDKALIILAQDIIENVTNKNHINDESVKIKVQQLIDKQSQDKKDLAQKKKEAIMKQMQQKKNANKFMKQIGSSNMQEEVGPKCIVCLEGYTKKPTEILGMYVFCKRAKITEISASGSGFINTQGYSTVTHSNFIHFVCHQNAYRADQGLRQPKKEWEGAVIRNDHTKCNNLLPIKGGSLTDDVYLSMFDKYFQMLVKSVGNCDGDKAKVLLHDLKMLLKRFAYEDSFSRDSQGGGPEHNMHLIPLFYQMIQFMIDKSPMYTISHPSNSSGVNSSLDKDIAFIQEKRLYEFLEQGMQQKKDFMTKLEEEKKLDEIEEEEKFSEEMSSQQEDEPEDEQQNTMNSLTLDQISFFLTNALIFTQLEKWEDYKMKFLTIILCTLASQREDKQGGLSAIKLIGQQSDLAQGKRVLTLTKQDDQQQHQEDIDMLSAGIGGSAGRRKRLISENKFELMQKSLIKLRPLLVLMRLIDAIKQKWDGKRASIIFGMQLGATQIKTDTYIQKIVQEFLAKDNLSEVISDCDELFREYKERMLKITSVEEFLQDMNLLDKITAQHSSVESFVVSHF